MAWNNVGNIKGPQGPQGPQGNAGTPGTAGTNGAAGARGSLWYTGSGAPGTIAGSQAGDQYLDTASGNVYTLS
jgi:hypothetical protein